MSHTLTTREERAQWLADLRGEKRLWMEETEIVCRFVAVIHDLDRLEDEIQQASAPQPEILSALYRSICDDLDRQVAEAFRAQMFGARPQQDERAQRRYDAARKVLDDAR